MIVPVAWSFAHLVSRTAGSGIDSILKDIDVQTLESIPGARSSAWTPARGGEAVQVCPAAAGIETEIDSRLSMLGSGLKSLGTSPSPRRSTTEVSNCSGKTFTMPSGSPSNAWESSQKASSRFPDSIAWVARSPSEALWASSSSRDSPWKGVDPDSARIEAEE